MPKLASIDLNLLIALDALLEESNVTRAASRIGVSQSAMSHSLRRLRYLMSDPLLVRVGNRMQLSQRARILRPQVREAVRRAEAVLTPPREIEPAQLERTFRIQCYDTTQLLLLPKLSRRLEATAPGVRIEVQDLSIDRLVERLSCAETDLALFWLADLELPESIAREPLFTDRHVGLVRQGHPALPGPLEWPAYARLRHLVVLPRGKAYPLSQTIESGLAEHGFERRKSMTLSGLLAVPEVLAATDDVAVVSERAADLLGRWFPLQKIELPLASTRHEVTMVWNTHQAHDPAFRWFRKQVADLCARL